MFSQGSSIEQKAITTRAGAVAAARVNYAAAGAMKAEVRGLNFYYGQGL